jgi:hypothetical protein
MPTNVRQISLNASTNVLQRGSQGHIFPPCLVDIVQHEVMVFADKTTFLSSDVICDARNPLIICPDTDTDKWRQGYQDSLNRPQ